MEDVRTEEVTTEEAIGDVTAEAEMPRHEEEMHLLHGCFAKGRADGMTPRIIGRIKINGTNRNPEELMISEFWITFLSSPLTAMMLRQILAVQT
ncbi:MAG: hypothetical protein IPF58_06245 [Saprospirales bacterium]|nr:hypothetical protein [Saprospirales bacterium]